MINAVNIALTGMQAAEERLKNSASNLANQNTPGYKATEVEQTPQELGGVRTDVVERDPATLTVSDTQGDTVEIPNVSPEQEVAEQVQATSSYQANARVVKVQADLQETLVNISA